MLIWIVRVVCAWIDRFFFWSLRYLLSKVDLNIADKENGINVLLAELEGGDIRSIGAANEVADRVIDEIGYFPLLVEGFFVEDPIIRSRASDAAVKVLDKKPVLLQPFKARILSDLPLIDQKETKWHYCLMIKSLDLNEKEQRIVYNQLIDFLNEDNKFLKVHAMQALVDLTLTYSIKTKEIIDIVEKLATYGSASMQARGRHLLKDLDKAGLLKDRSWIDVHFVSIYFQTGTNLIGI